MSARGRGALIGLGALVVLLLAVHAARRDNTGDLAVYYEAGVRLRAGHDLYQEREGPRAEHPTGYIYPPPFALVMAPLSLLPFPLVRGLWFVLGAACALRAFVLSARLLAPIRPPPGRRAAALALALGVGLSLRAVWNDLGHGQVNLILVWLTLEAVAAAEGERDGLAGALLAGALVLKLVPGLFLAAYLLASRWRLVGVTAGVGLALLLSPALVVGPSACLDLTRRFATEATAWHAGYALALPNNVAPAGALFRVLAGHAHAFGEPTQPLLLSLHPDTARAACSALSLALLAGALLVARRGWGGAGTPERARSLALLAAAVPLISPVAWKPHLVWLILPGLLAGRLLLSPGRHRWLLGAAWALVVLTGRFPLGKQISLQAYLWGAPALGLALLFAGLASAPLPAPAASDDDDEVPA